MELRSVRSDIEAGDDISKKRIRNTETDINGIVELEETRFRKNRGFDRQEHAQVSGSPLLLPFLSVYNKRSYDPLV